MQVRAAHPNATANVLTSSAAGLVLYVLDRVGVHDLTAADGAAIVAAATSVVLFIGRRGIRGTLSAIWRGTSDQPATASEARRGHGSSRTPGS